MADRAILTPEDCLRLLGKLDAGEDLVQRINENGSPEFFVVFQGHYLQRMVLANLPVGVALPTAAGAQLSRRGHATSERYRINSTQWFRYYWLTEAGRAALRALPDA